MSLVNTNNELMTDEEYIRDKKKIEDEISQLGKKLNTVDNKIEEANNQTYKIFTLLIVSATSYKTAPMRKEES